jgi:uncharacterized protein YukE
VIRGGNRSVGGINIFALKSHMEEQRARKRAGCLLPVLSRVFLITAICTLAICGEPRGSWAGEDVQTSTGANPPAEGREERVRMLQGQRREIKRRIKDLEQEKVYLERHIAQNPERLSRLRSAYERYDTREFNDARDRLWLEVRASDETLRSVKREIKALEKRLSEIDKELASAGAAK